VHGAEARHRPVSADELATVIGVTGTALTDLLTAWLQVRPVRRNRCLLKVGNGPV